MTSHRATRLAAALLLAVATRSAALDGESSGLMLDARLFEGIPHRIALADPIAYVALDSGLATYDVSDAMSPIPLGHVYLPSEALDVAVAGNHAFVAAGESGLLVVDVSDPSRPTWVAALATSGTRAVAVAGGIAYLGEASLPPATVYGLRTVDVRNPLAPLELGFVALANGALDVAVSGTTAFVGTGSDAGNPVNGLYAIDVSNPASPQPVLDGLLRTGKPVNEVVVEGGIAYLATGFPSTGALVTVNVTVPGAPALLASMPLADAGRGLALQAGVVCVAARSLGILTFDVADPARPFLLDALQTGRETVAVAARGDTAFLGERASIEQASLTAVDTLDPSMLRALSATPFAEATAAAMAPGLAYFLRRDALHIHDANTPGTLVPLATWRPPRGDFSALAVSGGLAAIAEGSSVRLVDVANPRSPFARGSVTVSLGVAVRVVLAGSTLYVVTGAGLETFAVNDPSAPTAMGTYSTPGWSSALAVEGTIGYLAAGDTLHVLDLGAPALPAAIATLRIPGERLYGVAASDTRVVLTGLENLLYTVDATDPASPQLRATVAGGTGFDLTLSGVAAIVAAGRDGIIGYDVSDLASPAEVASYDTSGTAMALASDGQTVYLATVAAQHWALTCSTCPFTCPIEWPTIEPNSLKLGKVPVNRTLYWRIASGSGATNVHLTLVKTALPTLYQDQATLLGFSGPTTYSDGFEPAVGAVAHYQVFGRETCTGNSHAP